MRRAPRIALAFPFPLEPGHRGKDVLLIPEGLQELGFEVELYCPEAVGTGWSVPVVRASREEQDDPAYWAERRLDGAVVYTFLSRSSVARALTAAGVRVVGKADTTGNVVARHAPRATLTYAFHDPQGMAARALSVARWAAVYGPLFKRNARALVSAVQTPAVTAIESETARRAVAESLDRVGAADCVDRLVVVPNPVDVPFTRGPMPGAKERIVVAIGRWDVRVKDAPLLAEAAQRFLARRSDYRLVVVGRHGEPYFDQPCSGAARVPRRGRSRGDAGPARRARARSS